MAVSWALIKLAKFNTATGAAKPESWVLRGSRGVQGSSSRARLMALSRGRRSVVASQAGPRVERHGAAIVGTAAGQVQRARRCQ